MFEGEKRQQTVASLLLVLGYVAAALWAAIILNVHDKYWLWAVLPTLVLSPILGWRLGKGAASVALLPVLAFLPGVVAIPFGYSEDYVGSEAMLIPFSQFFAGVFYFLLMLVGVGLRWWREGRRGPVG
jgi:hypothetical protein